MPSRSKSASGRRNSWPNSTRRRMRTTHLAISLRVPRPQILQPLPHGSSAIGILKEKQPGLCHKISPIKLSQTCDNCQRRLFGTGKSGKSVLSPFCPASDRNHTNFSIQPLAFPQCRHKCLKAALRSQLCQQPRGMGVSFSRAFPCACQQLQVL